MCVYLILSPLYFIVAAHGASAARLLTSGSKQSAGGRPQPRVKEGYSGETVAQTYFHSVSVPSAERGEVGGEGGVKIKVRTK